MCRNGDQAIAGVQFARADGGLATANAGSAEPAVAVWIFREVLPLIILGTVELGRVRYFGGNHPVAIPGQLALVIFP
jgi:hypothetical protein